MRSAIVALLLFVHFFFLQWPATKLSFSAFKIGNEKIAPFFQIKSFPTLVIERRRLIGSSWIQNLSSFPLID